MRIRLGRRSPSSTTLGVLGVLAALGAVILLRAPEPAAAVPRDGAIAPMSSPGAPTASAQLAGPAIDGVFALGEGAVLASGSTDVYAELRLTGLASSSDAPRAPVALAVVLDHSGSMGGAKMQQADEAVVSLLERMHDDDWLSVVVYDHAVEVLQPLAPVASLRAELPPRVRAVQAAGGTNIPSGSTPASRRSPRRPTGSCAAWSCSRTASTVRARASSSSSSGSGRSRASA